MLPGRPGEIQEDALGRWEAWQGLEEEGAQTGGGDGGTPKAGAAPSTGAACPHQEPTCAPAWSSTPRSNSGPMWSVGWATSAHTAAPTGSLDCSPPRAPRQPPGQKTEMGAVGQRVGGGIKKLVHRHARPQR